MKKTNFKRALAFTSTFAIALNLAVTPTVYATEIDSKDIVAEDVQTACTKDVLTLNA